MSADQQAGHGSVASAEASFSQAPISSTKASNSSAQPPLLLEMTCQAWMWLYQMPAVAFYHAQNARQHGHPDGPLIIFADNKRSPCCTG